MIVQTLRSLFKRDLEKLKQEILSYKDEKNLWIVDANIANCGGNLCLHLVGNLNTFIGAQLGNSGYIRQRKLEFSLKDVAREELIHLIEDTIKIVDESLSGLTDEILNSDYPIIVFDKKMSTHYFLVHLATHLAYHLGQINYHRRLLDV